jgi:hypothetical protein
MNIKTNASFGALKQVDAGVLNVGYAEVLERRLAEGPVITVPTITLEGDANGAPTRTPVPMPRNSQATVRIGSSPAASGTTCHRKHPRPSTMPSSTWMATDDRHAHVSATQPNVVERACPVLEGATDGPRSDRVVDIPHQNKPALPRHHAPGGGPTAH